MEQKNEEAFSSNTLGRGLYMLLFAVFYNIAEFVMAVVAIIQFGFKLVTGKTNDQLLEFGQSLATYIYQTISFLVFRTEDKPFPFSEWPKGAPVPVTAPAEQAGAVQTEAKAEEKAEEKVQEPVAEQVEKKTEDVKESPETGGTKGA